MFRTSTNAIFRAARELVWKWPALALMTATYALLLTSVYVFVNTREATTIQIVITAGLGVSTTVFFLILQTLSAGYTRAITARELFVSSLKNCWKLLLVSLPIIAVTMLAAYILTKLQTGLSFSIPEAVLEGSQSARPQTHWGEIVLISLRYLLIGLFAPLALIQLWISTSNHGLAETLKRILTPLRRSFAAGSVLIYIAGSVTFGLIPYLILFKTSISTGAWVEIGLLTARLAFVFCLTLLGWVITVGALAVAEDSVAQPARKDS